MKKLVVILLTSTFVAPLVFAFGYETAEFGVKKETAALIGGILAMVAIIIIALRIILQPGEEFEEELEDAHKTVESGAQRWISGASQIGSKKP